MKIILQRVISASVTLKNNPNCVNSIGKGYALLIGISEGDTESDALRLAHQLAKIRLMNNAEGVMGLNIKDAAGEVLAVSQFTLLSDFSKGNRPSFHRAAKAEPARGIFNYFVTKLSEILTTPIQTGFFGEDMILHIINDGPFTIILE